MTDHSRSLGTFGGLVPRTVRGSLTIRDGRLSVALRNGGVVTASCLDGAASVVSGDDVLLTCSDDDEWFVLGVIARDGAAAPREITATGDQRVVVRDASGEILFEHEPATGHTRVRVPQGDLVLEAPGGSVQLRAGHGVHIAASETLTLQASERIDLATGALSQEPGTATTPSDAEASPASTASMTITRGSVNIAADDVQCTARRTVLDSGDVDLHAGWLRSHIETLSQTFGRVETRAEQIIERAKNTYREVENLAQIRAARIRMVAREALNALGREVQIDAEEHVNVRGRKVYLG